SRDRVTVCGQPLSRFTRALGEDLSFSELRKRLSAYGHTVTGTARTVTVSSPAYRDDIMHPVDLVEDYAISRGYDAFHPLMPRESTVGGLSGIETFSDTVRSHMVGAGFQEVVSNILCSREELGDLLLPGEALVEVDNAMSLAYSVLRNRVLPSLLNMEAASSKAFYPHRIFEAGEVSVVDPGDVMGTRTDLNLAGLIAHPAANFSEMHSVLDMLLYYLGVEYRLEPAEHPLFLPGRCGTVVAAGQGIGLIGEVRPEALEKRQITMPCAGFEIVLNMLMELTGTHPQGA
ncbi:MAG TPA: phenylalanine--tRNA ligase subunit beta, partial [Nitrospirota bacterium]|nr:phenylalanine--tRNA ligase subunit beta [Nitrospirota bacterium]